MAGDNNNASITWDFPLPRTHTGVLMGNGLQGLMIWGQKNQLNITVGRAGFWDRRGGKSFLSIETTYDQLVHLLKSDQKNKLDSIFDTNDGNDQTPDKPFQIGGGVLKLQFPDQYHLEKARLFFKKGELLIDVKNKQGQQQTIRIRQAVKNELTRIDLPDRLYKDIHIKLSPAYEHINVKPLLQKYRIKAPRFWAYTDSLAVGFVQSLPQDPSLGLGYKKKDNTILVATAMGHNVERQVNQILELEWGRVEEQRDDWWSQYWADVPDLQLPDPLIKEIYDYGLYKMACTHPPHGIPATLQGPFNESYQLPPWGNDYHLNINAEMIYLPVLAANRAAHLDPLWEMLMKWYPDMKRNGEAFYQVDNAIIMPHAVDDKGHVRGSFWTGSIDQACAAWMAQLAWQHYQYTLDERILNNVAFPLMKGAFNGYWGMIEEIDGALRMPVSVSPEFKGKRIDAWGENASFQLAACHMTAQNLIQASEVLDVAKDYRWQKVVDDLPPYQTITLPRQKEYPEYESTRIALWKGMDLVESHRHHSHLASIYPFMTINPDDAQHQTVVDASVNHWVMTGPGNWAGWSFPWASSLHARMGHVDAAVAWLHLWEQAFTNIGRGTLHDAAFSGVSRNQTDWRDIQFMASHNEIMQLDAGFGALDAIHNILVQQRGEVLHVLPDIPRNWRDFSFKRVGAPGAFLISGFVEKGKLIKIEIKSLAGGEIQLAHGMGQDCYVNSHYYEGRIIQKSMRKNKKMVITSD